MSKCQCFSTSLPVTHPQSESESESEPELVSESELEPESPLGLLLRGSSCVASALPAALPAPGALLFALLALLPLRPLASRKVDGRKARLQPRKGAHGAVEAEHRRAPSQHAHPSQLMHPLQAAVRRSEKAKKLSRM